MELSGLQIKERLERDLGFEANRARMLVEGTASEEISTYWAGRKLESVDPKTFIAISKSALVAGVAGRQRLSEHLQKIIGTPPNGMSVVEITAEVNALVSEHQKTLNLSRHRATCVNAHLNVLEPDRSLVQVYSRYLSTVELSAAQGLSRTLLERKIRSAEEFLHWVMQVHALLVTVSVDSQEKSSVDSPQEYEDSTSKKGLISRKAIGTYYKQWEMFAVEKLGAAFSLPFEENDSNPLSTKLNRLENGFNRTWSAMLTDLTEAKTSSVFLKRAFDVTKSPNFFAWPETNKIDNFELELSGRLLTIQLSNKGITSELVAQFAKAMKAQFFVYSGKGPFTLSLQGSGCIMSVSILDVRKSDLEKIEEIILALL
jgi:hypothetical protein